MFNKFRRLIVIALFIVLFIPVKSVEATTYKEFLENAQKSSSEVGIYTSVVLAQYTLESGLNVVDGKLQLSGLASSPNFNLFGIKCGGYPTCTDPMTTNEDYGNGMVTIKDSFRMYPSHKESFTDHAQLILNQKGLNTWIQSGTLKGEKNKIYSCSWREYASDYKEATLCLQGSYATDPQYSSKLISIIEERDFAKYDGEYSGSSSSDDEKGETGADSKYVGEDAWKNKMVNFQNTVYANTFKGIATGSDGFINSAFISGINKLSDKTLNIAYIIMMVFTTGLFLFMGVMTMVYLVILPNGLGGYKLADFFEKTTGLSASVSQRTTIDMISRLGITTILVACLYANLLPVLISSFIEIILYFLALF